MIVDGSPDSQFVTEASSFEFQAHITTRTAAMRPRRSSVHAAIATANPFKKANHEVYRDWREGQTGGRGNVGESVDDIDSSQGRRLPAERPQ